MFGKKTNAAGSITGTKKIGGVTTVDTVVVGSGISGATAAFYLHNKGINVLLTEAKDQVGGNLISRKGAQTSQLVKKCVLSDRSQNRFHSYAENAAYYFLSTFFRSTIEQRQYPITHCFPITLPIPDMSQHYLLTNSITRSTFRPTVARCVLISYYYLIHSQRMAINGKKDQTPFNLAQQFYDLQKISVLSMI